MRVNACQRGGIDLCPPCLDLLLDQAVLRVAGIVLVRQAPLVAGEDAPRLKHAIDLAVHALPDRSAIGIDESRVI